MFKRRLMLLCMLASGVIAVGLGLRAVAQQAPTSAADSSAAADASAPADDPELRQSADNNISFPVDI